MKKTTHYVVCANDETIESCDLDPEIWESIEAADSTAEVVLDSIFSRWHGGKYGSQAAQYGYGTPRFGVICTGVTFDDESGESDFVRFSDLNADEQARILAVV